MTEAPAQRLVVVPQRIPLSQGLAEIAGTLAHLELWLNRHSEDPLVELRLKDIHDSAFGLYSQINEFTKLMLDKAEGDQTVVAANAVVQFRPDKEDRTPR